MSVLDEMAAALRVRSPATADELAALGASVGASPPANVPGTSVLAMAEAIQMRILVSVADGPIEALTVKDRMFILRVVTGVVASERAIASEQAHALPTVPRTRDEVVAAIVRAVGPMALA